MAITLPYSMIKLVLHTGRAVFVFGTPLATICFTFSGGDCNRCTRRTPCTTTVVYHNGLWLSRKHVQYALHATAPHEVHDGTYVTHAMITYHLGGGGGRTCDHTCQIVTNHRPRISRALDVRGGCTRVLMHTHGNAEQHPRILNMLGRVAALGFHWAGQRLGRMTTAA